MSKRTCESQRMSCRTQFSPTSTEEESVGMMLPFINIKIRAQWLPDKMRNGYKNQHHQLLSCSAVPAREPALCCCPATSRRGSSKQRLVVSSSTVQERARNPLLLVLTRSCIPREDHAPWAKLSQYTWLSDRTSTAIYPVSSRN